MHVDRELSYSLSLKCPLAFQTHWKPTWTKLQPTDVIRFKVNEEQATSCIIFFPHFFAPFQLLCNCLKSWLIPLAVKKRRFPKFPE